MMIKKTLTVGITSTTDGQIFGPYYDMYRCTVSIESHEYPRERFEGVHVHGMKWNLDVFTFYHTDNKQ